MLSCISQDPLMFVVVPPEIDDTLNISTKSIDYDGDCEDYNDMNTDSSSDEESFYVGRSRLSSYRSVDEFSDDETTMDTEAFNRAAYKNTGKPKEVHAEGSFLGLIPKHIDSDDEEENKYINHTFKYSVEVNSNVYSVNNNKLPPPNPVKRRRLKRKHQHHLRSAHPYRKRTRSMSREYSR